MLPEKYDFEIHWYGDGRQWIWSAYHSAAEALSRVQGTETPPAPKWRIVRNVYQLVREEDVESGEATGYVQAPSPVGGESVTPERS